MKIRKIILKNHKSTLMESVSTNDPNLIVMQYDIELLIDRVNLAVTFPCHLAVAAAIKRGGSIKITLFS